MENNYYPPLGELFTKSGRPDQKKVTYLYHEDVPQFSYGITHAMKPQRVGMAHNLIIGYGLYKRMEIVRPIPASKLEMSQFHTDDYLDFLSIVTPENQADFPWEIDHHEMGTTDIPIFDGMYELASISSGGSIEGAARLNRGRADIAINWAGGLHHAKKSIPSGFCYVNDIVLGIMELLRVHQRVLYIDIDVHHGDGVEEAFYNTDRVMTASFHKFGKYFPCTGDLTDSGAGRGKNYSVNFPLKNGITDVTYKYIFEPVIGKIMERYRPGAVVLQCGADSLSGDAIGCFNLSMNGHANCVKFVKSFNIPSLILGGGGYTIKNVARAWAYETGVLLDTEMDPVLPKDRYYEYYGPEYMLDVRSSSMRNNNSRKYLEKVTIHLMEQLRDIPFAPSVQMRTVPCNPLVIDDEIEALRDDEDEDENYDVRYTQYRLDRMVERDDELISDSSDEDRSAL